MKMSKLILTCKYDYETFAKLCAGENFNVVSALWGVADGSNSCIGDSNVRLSRDEDLTGWLLYNLFNPFTERFEFNNADELRSSLLCKCKFPISNLFSAMGIDADGNEYSCCLIDCNIHRLTRYCAYSKYDYSGSFVYHFGYARDLKNVIFDGYSELYFTDSYSVYCKNSRACIDIYIISKLDSIQIIGNMSDTFSDKFVHVVDFSNVESSFMTDAENFYNAHIVDSKDIGIFQSLSFLDISNCHSIENMIKINANSNCKHIDLDLTSWCFDNVIKANGYVDFSDCNVMVSVSDDKFLGMVRGTPPDSDFMS